MTNRYRRRPDEIEAVQWTGTNADVLRAFAPDRFATVAPEDRINEKDDAQVLVEESHWVAIRPGEWVLKFEGYFVSKCDEAFRAVWEPAAEQPTAAPLASEREQEWRQQIAEALMRWAEQGNSPAHAAARRQEIVVKNAYARADAVLPIVRATVAAETAPLMTMLRAEREQAEGIMRGLHAEVDRLTSLVGQYADRAIQNGENAGAERNRALTEAADTAEDVAESLRAHYEFERSTGALDVMTELRRMAATPTAEERKAPLDPAVILGIGADQPERWQHRNHAAREQGEADGITVRPEEYTVTAVPDDASPDAHVWALTVRHRGGNRWAVQRGEHECLGADGEWAHGVKPYDRGDDWLNAHRFDLATALRLAREAALHVTVNGYTVAYVLTRHAGGA